MVSKETFGTYLIIMGYQKRRKWYVRTDNHKFIGNRSLQIQHGTGNLSPVPKLYYNMGF
jgi:hypothetical protein